MRLALVVVLMCLASCSRSNWRDEYHRALEKVEIGYASEDAEDAYEALREFVTYVEQMEASGVPFESYDTVLAWDYARL